MPAAIRPGTAAARAPGIEWPEFEAPAAHGLVRNVNAAFSEKVFNIAETQREKRKYSETACWMIEGGNR